MNDTNRKASDLCDCGPKIQKIRIVDADLTRKGIYLRAVASVTDRKSFSLVVEGAKAQNKGMGPVANALRDYFGVESLEDVVAVMAENPPGPNSEIESEYRVCINPRPVWTAIDLISGTVELVAFVAEE